MIKSKCDQTIKLWRKYTYDVSLLLGFAKDHFVVDAGKEKIALLDVQLILLPFLDGAVIFIHVLDDLIALAALLEQDLVVRHGMTDDRDPLSHFLLCCLGS